MSRSTRPTCAGAAARPACRCTTAWLAAAPPRAGSTTRCPAACSRPPRTCAASTASPRQEQDELAVASHQRAVAAQKNGILAEEIIPVTVRTRQGEQVIDTDEHPARRHLRRVAGQAQTGSGQAGSGCHRDSRQLQRPERRRVDVHGHHAEKAAELGLTPLVRLVSWAIGGRGSERHGHRSGARRPRSRWARPVCS